MRPAPLFLFCGLVLGFPAHGQSVPACGAAQDGVVACLSGTLCTCRFIRGGSITGQRDRQAWDCGILRPACGEVPATLPNRGGLSLPGFAGANGLAPNLLFGPGQGSPRKP